MAVTRELQCGHTRVTLIEGEPLDHPREGLLLTVNARGVMASGLAGAIRLAAGGEVERELRSLGSLLVGRAYRLDPGLLAARGIAHLVCGITVAEPGQSPRRTAVEEALSSAFDVLDGERVRTLTLPEIGTRIPGIELSVAAELLVDVLTGRLRRGSLLDDVVIAGLHLEYLRACRVALERSGATVIQ